MGPDLDLSIIARGTPGMSGADLANLVNEAALHAVRRGSQFIEMRDFDAARDRILMGQPRDSLVLSDLEKARVAYHEGGHAVLAYVLTHADPLLKVSIIPRALRSESPATADRGKAHLPREYIEDALVVRMGGRVAEMLVYGDLSTGASDTSSATPSWLARWSVNGACQSASGRWPGFAGNGLPRRGPHAHSRLLRGHEPCRRRRGRQDPAGTGGSGYRRAARAQGRAGGGRARPARVEKVDGAEIGRLVDVAYGRPVHGGAEGEEKLVTERYAPSLSGTVMAQPRRHVYDRRRSDRGLTAASETAAHGLRAPGDAASRRAPRTQRGRESRRWPWSIRRSASTAARPGSGRSPRPAGRTRGISQERIEVELELGSAFRLRTSSSGGVLW